MAIWLTEFRALFDVSLVFLSSTPPEAIQGRCTHERHHNIVMTLSANSYTSLCAFSGAVLGFSRYSDRILDIYIRTNRKYTR